MDRIHITDLRFLGKHGCFAHERENEQEFLTEVLLHVDVANAGKSDTIIDTIDFDAVRSMVKEVIEGPTKSLVETLAENIAQNILKDIRIISAEVTIKKTAVWENGVPGVTVVRKKVVTLSPACNT